MFAAYDESLPKTLEIEFITIYKFNEEQKIIATWMTSNRAAAFTMTAKTEEIPVLFETDPNLITAEWLTNVLHETKALPENVSVQSVVNRSVGEVQGYAGRCGLLDLTFSGEFKVRFAVTSSLCSFSITFDNSVGFLLDLCEELSRQIEPNERRFESSVRTRICRLQNIDTCHS